MFALTIPGFAIAIPLVVGLAACAGDEDAPPSGSESARVSESPSEDELFREALGRYTEYGKASASIWGGGDATPQSEQLFREYFVDWERPQGQLEGLESNGVTLDGVAKVGWSRPGEITSETVTIEQCILKDATAFKDGVELPPAGPGHPYLVSIVLRRASDGEFKIDATTPTETPCEA